MRYGHKRLDKHRKMGSTYCAQCCSVFISSKNSVKIWPKKNFLDIAATARSAGVKKPFFSKKCLFLLEKCIFFRKMAFWPPAERGVAAMSKKFFFWSYFYTIFWWNEDWATLGTICWTHFSVFTQPFLTISHQNKS